MNSADNVPYCPGSVASSSISDKLRMMNDFGNLRVVLTVYVACWALKDGCTILLHNLCRFNLFRRLLVASIIRLSNNLVYKYPNRNVSLHTGSANGPPDQSDSILSCVVSWNVPPGILAGKALG